MTDSAVLSNRGQLILVAIGLLFILYLFSLLRKQKITESHGLLWLFVSIAMIVIVSIDKLLMGFTHILGAQYPSSALTMIGLLFIIVLLLFFTLQITNITYKFRQLVQELSLQNADLQTRLQALEKNMQEKGEV